MGANPGGATLTAHQLQQSLSAKGAAASDVLVTGALGARVPAHGLMGLHLEPATCPKGRPRLPRDFQQRVVHMASSRAWSECMYYDEEVRRHHFTCGGLPDVPNMDLVMDAFML